MLKNDSDPARSADAFVVTSLLPLNDAGHGGPQWRRLSADDVGMNCRRRRIEVGSC
jgi:hypothetical protein